jgi:hypothetical protein
MASQDPTPPASGHYRIACDEPCEVQFANLRTEGIVWNVSTVGAYLLLNGPLPEPGSVLRLTFSLPGDPEKISCYARVAWQNPASIFKGCGTVAARLPPGCGFQFVNLQPGDWNRIQDRVQAVHPGRPAVRNA